MPERQAPRNPQCSLTLNLFLGAIYSPHQLDWNRQKSDPTGWKWNLPRAFPRDQGRQFPTKCYIQWVLKCKGIRGSLGKLIHFPIINLHLKFPVTPLTGVRRLRKEHRKAPQSAVTIPIWCSDFRLPTQLPCDYVHRHTGTLTYFQAPNFHISGSQDLRSRQEKRRDTRNLEWK